MNQQTFEALEYNAILTKIASYTRTDAGKETVLELKPLENRKQIEAKLAEVMEAMAILERSGSVPIHSLGEMEHFIEQGKKGLYVRADQFNQVLSFLDHCRKLKQFMKDKEAIAPAVSSYAFSIESMDELEAEISRCLRHGQVDDHASSELAYARRQLATLNDKVKEKAQGLLKNKRFTPYLQDKTLSERNGRIVLSVKKEYRAKVAGTVLDTSASGSTLFIEPHDLSDIQADIAMMKLAEEAEVERILYDLTAQLLTYEQAIRIAVEVMHHYDVLFAKAKYSQVIEAIAPNLNEDDHLSFLRARHPMLAQSAVPLTIQFGEEERALVITGPNTGGKTVTLKTIGLLTIMAQAGLPIPVDAGSSVAIFKEIYVDIGDGQSISDNLSTFSSRMVNIIDIMRKTNDRSLVLIDELGSGTDPAEGMALAIVILEQLFKKGATLFATTHYSEMKDFAQTTPGFLNASMEFDLNTLAPTYRLLMDETGKSQAFDIALKLGMHPEMVERAHEVAYKEEYDYQSRFEPSALKELPYEQQIIVNKYRKKKKTAPKEIVVHFNQGDNVTVQATNETAIVYKGPDVSGNYIVQIKGEKRTVNQKRLKLAISASELYPADYDFDQIFKSVAYRKTKRDMSKKHVDGQSLNEE
ncbi:MutS2 family protein [Alkalihalobacillus xiaoxiensis]|uniref:MutS2 family protein n=1 Tax=Shouchella xiaoxiensis TaxID=766895 RepID=A0ABS2SWY9_9BACI|nr:endonuclease MutS2 [Shouchella xiaoxiensis]MBM7839701.1 MutS2 family protein [Shouchella xiaoxiensis]